MWQSNYGNVINNDTLEAQTFDYIVVHSEDVGSGGSYGSRFTTVKAANPNVKFLQYVALNEIGTDSSSAWHGLNESDYLHNPYRTLTPAARVVDSATSRYVADVTQAHYQSIVAAAVKSLMTTYRLQGIYADHSQWYAGQPGNSIPGGGITQTQWASGMYAIADLIHGQGVFQIWGSSYPDGSGQDGNLVSHIDATLSEGAFHTEASSTVTDPMNGGAMQFYALWASLFNRNQGQGKIFAPNPQMHPQLSRGGDPIWNAHWLTWGLANTLLYSNGTAIFGWNNGEWDEAASECQYVDMNVGQPTGAYTTTRNGLLVRRFSGGSIAGVIVNATGNMATNDAGFGPGSLGPYTGFIQ